MKKGDAVDAVIMGKYTLPGLVEAVTQSAVDVVFVRHYHRKQGDDSLETGGVRCSRFLPGFGFFLESKAKYLIADSTSQRIEI